MQTLTSIARLAGLTAALALFGCGSEPPRVPFPTASTTPAVTAPVLTAPVATGASTTYLCNQGSPLSVTMTPGAPTLTYSYAGYPGRQMTQGAGGVYTDGTYDLMLQGNQASLAYAGTGQPFDVCTRA
jgi:hypothetical protein